MSGECERCGHHCMYCTCNAPQCQTQDELIAAAEERGRIAGLREAAEIADTHYAAGDMGNPGHHILARIPATQSDEVTK